MALARQRDPDTCLWCGRPFAGLVRPTTDHLIPKVKGGPSWLEKEVAACRRCNGERGGQRRARPHLETQLRRLRTRQPTDGRLTA